MTHLFKGLLAAVLVGLTIGAGAAAITIDRNTSSPVHTTKADTKRVMTIGQSSLTYRFTEHSDQFELHVIVRDQNDPDDMYQTRIKMRDTQVFSMVLNNDDLPTQNQGDRVSFRRDGAALIVRVKRTAPETRFASMLWPFD